ncbi:ATP-binding protein [Chitinophaga sancti]|uniref:AAA domain-containing protein, putative AbiEii toxin, Type IV TA system n=1 Tax=Chitinophaga sancti TaxID=1004 RepID=A0A1K1SQT1_9BACT|nr:AAA family ATPase [Chitinophaga sancti]WQD61039.1 AAA family ATPase [Chitinophaga sancti]WQG86832.1 AAA family ATPase [Chitinophaga sancti]SFW86588.1 AAA domain-containing protein, putative AbiEii toxin, Type IV TA system [Chitinophaga sancti]
MNRIKIQHFGPIGEGFSDDDGFMDIKKFTVFIGNQGTGKSSVAKLISTLSWLEKALFRSEIKENYVTGYNRFVKEYVNYQNIRNYFRENTVITYEGAAYNFDFRDGKLQINRNPGNIEEVYRAPKIMYVPAERNFLSAVENPEKLKGLPKTLSTFWEEMQRSLQELSASIELPLGNAKLEYDKLNRIPKIDLGEGRKLRLSEASSGFQSFIPLFLVSRNLSMSINRESNSSKNQLSGEQQQRLQMEIERIILDTSISQEVKENAMRLLSSKYKNESFLNIVEEIEQNLFPQSQKIILFKLIEYANRLEKNQLILTTHSPYIINYLTIAIKGYQLWNKMKGRDQNLSLQEKLNEIVPLNSCVDGEETIIYQLTENGSIFKLPSFEGIPSDNNYLNHILADINDSFDKLLEIEEEIV